MEDGVGDWRETRENRVWATAAEGRERSGGNGFGMKWALENCVFFVLMKSGMGF